MPQWRQGEGCSREAKGRAQVAEGQSQQTSQGEHAKPETLKPQSPRGQGCSDARKSCEGETCERPTFTERGRDEAAKPQWRQEQVSTWAPHGRQAAARQVATPRRPQALVCPSCDNARQDASKPLSRPERFLREGPWPLNAAVGSP